MVNFFKKKTKTDDQTLIFYYLTDEPVAEEPFNYEMELDDLPRERLKALVFEEVLDFRRRAQLTEQLNRPVLGGFNGGDSGCANGAESAMQS